MRITDDNITRKQLIDFYHCCPKFKELSDICEVLNLAVRICDETYLAIITKHEALKNVNIHVHDVAAEFPHNETYPIRVCVSLNMHSRSWFTESVYDLIDYAASDLLKYLFGYTLRIRLQEEVHNDDILKSVMVVDKDIRLTLPEQRMTATQLKIWLDLNGIDIDKLIGV